ncbi:MAG TPA: BON domain-containing protein [Steroidobacteraceae bacterium]|nr:BON domain-containing protein [Steroidobacteraceae bacterium]
MKRSHSTLYLCIAAAALTSAALPAMSNDTDRSPAVAVATDNLLLFRVSSALQSDPYLYVRHIEVSLKDGAVLLTGFVTNDWELDKALRLATEAAKPHKVIDAIEIEIKEGGRR